jgi:hypothetical protein
LPPEPATHVRGQLLDAYLSEAHFSVNPKFDFSQSMTSSYAVHTDLSVEAAEDLRTARADLGVRIEWMFPPDADDPEVPFDLTVTITGEFEWGDQKPTTREDVEGWVEFNAEHLLWPYVRAQVAMITGASKLPPLTLYTITVPQPRLGQVEAVDEIEATPGG